MRRLMVLVMVAVLATCMIGWGAAATPNRSRVYEGPLGDTGVTIQFELIKRDGQPMLLRSFEFGVAGRVPVMLTCEDGSVEGVGLGWYGGLPKLPSHSLDLDEVSDMVLHIHGTIQAVHGSGTLSLTIARFMPDEQVQTCSTGELTWTVDRTVPPVEGPSTSPAIQVQHFVMATGARVTLTREA